MALVLGVRELSGFEILTLFVCVGLSTLSVLFRFPVAGFFGATLAFLALLAML